MAGTLSFDIAPLHVYQRKFNSDELERALRFSHLYIISRRPSTRIDYAYAGLGNAFFSISTRASIGGALVSSESRVQFPRGSRVKITTFEDGTYFALDVAGEILHGDSWSLLSMTTSARSEFAWQEVLYIGMAFGKDGERNVGHRVSEHSTLQKIYEDHAGTDWDIFVTPIEVNGNQMLSVDHIDDTAYGPDLRQYLRHFSQPSPIMEKRSKLSRESVELIEHSLVSVFRPAYNDKLLVWDPAKPTKSMRVAQKVGFRLMMLAFNGWHGLARYLSAADSRADRSNFFTFPLSKHPHPGPRGQLPPGDFGMVASAQNSFVAAMREADNSPSIISVFGPDAPAVRRPPSVVI